MTGYRVVGDTYSSGHQVRGYKTYNYDTDEYEYAPIVLRTRYRVDIKLPVNTAQNFTIKGNTLNVNETAGDIAITRVAGGINVVTSDRVTATNNIISDRITITFA